MSNAILNHRLLNRAGNRIQSVTFSSLPSGNSRADNNHDPLISNVVSILTQQRSKSRWSTIRSLCPSGFTPTQFSEIITRIRNDSHLAFRFFLFTRRHSLCSHGLLSCSTLIHVLARSRHKRHAIDLMHLAIQIAGDTEGYSLSESECLLAVFESLAKTYNRCGSAPFVFDLLIRSCLDSKKIDGSVMIVRLLRSKGISPQISTCNALISEVSKRRGAYEGYNIYREIFDLGVETKQDVKWVSTVRPNVQTFNTLMVRFYREGETGKLEEIRQEMEELGYSLNAYSYSIMIEAFCEGGMMNEAEKLWEEIGLKGLERDAMAYNSMIGGFCKSGDVRRAEEFYKEMGLNAVQSTSVTYNYLVNGYCKVGDVDSAVLVYRDMLRKAFDPERSTVEALIGGLCGKDRISEALEIMKAASKGSTFSPTGKCYKLLTKGFCKEGRMDEALKLQAEMVGRGFEPNSDVYTAFINGYAKQGNEMMVASLGKEMAESVSLQYQRFDKQDK